MADFTKALTVPYANGTDKRMRRDAKLYLNRTGDDGRVIAGKNTIAPGTVFTAADLMSPAELAGLLESGQAVFVGTHHDSARGVTIEPWFKKQLERRWNIEHLDTNALAAIEREELAPDPLLTSFTFDPGSPVYEVAAGRRLAVMRNDPIIYGRVMRSGERFTVDILDRASGRAEAYLAGAIAKGQAFGPVGHLNDRGKFVSLAQDDIPDPIGPEPPVLLEMADRKRIYGSMAIGDPLFRIEKDGTHGFSEGDLVAPSALAIRDRDQLVEAARSMIRKNQAVVIAHAVRDAGVVYVFSAERADVLDRWAEPKNRQHDYRVSMLRAYQASDAPGKQIPAVAGAR